MSGTVRYTVAVGAVLLASVALSGDARAQVPPPPRSEPEPEPKPEPKPEPEPRGSPADGPVDPYARDPAAPFPLPGEARGWKVRPTESYRRQTRWLKKKTKRGVQYTLHTVFAPFESALWLNRRFALVRRVEDVLYLGSGDRSYGLLPSVAFQSGFGGSYGLNAFHKSIFGNRERIAVKASYGGRFDQLVQLSLDAPQIFSGRYYLEGALRYEGKSEVAFYGIGNAPEVASGDPTLGPREAAVETQFRQRRRLAVLAGGAHFGEDGRRLRLGLSLVYNERWFDDIGIGEDYDISQLAGFSAGEDITEVTADLVLDTRDHGGKTGSGGLLDVFIGGAPSVDGNLFLHFGVEASYFLTLFRTGRVLVLRTMLEGVEADEESIPFTELPRLGGVSRLRGYRQDRFRDDLAFLGTLEYRYPIQHTVSGMFFVAAGKVAQTYDELAGTGIGDYWHPAFGGGLVLHTLTDVSFRLDLSYGEGFEVFFSSDALAAFRDRRREL